MKTSVLTVIGGVLIVSCLAASQGFVCQRGWTNFENTCFFFSPDKATWSNALTWCHVLGGRLAEPHSPVESNWLSHTAKTVSQEEWWLGIHDVESEGTFIWADSRMEVPFAQAMWQPGEPNGARGSNCVQYNTYGKWNDNPCSGHSRYICEKRAY